MNQLLFDMVKVFAPSTIAFIVGLSITPFISHYLYEHKLWKKKSGKQSGIGGGGTPIFNKLHLSRETGTPRMGGTIIWLSALITMLIVWCISQIFPDHEILGSLNFLVPKQTYLPLFTLVTGSLIGLIDDILEVRGTGTYLAGGLSLKKRLLVVATIGLIGAMWFYKTPGNSEIFMPFLGSYDIGIFFIPFFILVMIAVYSGGVIDGIDGLAGGVFMSIFSAFAGIAFFQGQINLAAFCVVIVGGLLAFLWFNIPPARFYMSETGTMGLTVTLVIVAFLTKQVMILPIVAFPLFITSLSDVIQVCSKKWRGGKKVFLVAPLHHHFEALGWPAHQVAMRYWVLSIVFAIIGMILAIIG